MAPRMPAHSGTGSGAFVAPWVAAFWASVVAVVPSDSGIGSPVAAAPPPAPTPGSPPVTGAPAPPAPSPPFVDSPDLPPPPLGAAAPPPSPSFFALDFAFWRFVRGAVAIGSALPWSAMSAWAVTHTGVWFDEDE